jgi:two-component system, OmpR family, sensor kinase
MRARAAEAGTQTRARWWDRRTLRFRIVASLLSVIVVAFAIIGVVTVFALNRFLLGRLDTQLVDSGGRYVASAAEHREGTSDGDNDSDDGFGDTRGQQVGTLGAHARHGLLDAFGVVGEPHAPSPSPSDRHTLTGLKAGHARSVDLGKLGDYRVEAFTAPDGDLAIVGLPLKPVHETLAELLGVELAVFGGVLVLTLLASGWLVGLSLRPLVRVTTTARQVSDVPLTDGDPALTARVPTPNSATEVGQLGVAFNRMLDHVEASLISRDASEARLRRFIADASHELRTPIASIRGHAESVRRTDNDLPASVLQSLSRVEAEAIRMGVLVDDLLLLARLDAGRPLARTTVDLTRIAIDSADDARVAGPDHHWLLDLPAEPITVVGDDHRLREVVTNLLTNARTHTPAGTSVELALAVAAERGVVVLSVTDNGPGIPVDVQPRVFERFYRADAARAPLTGSSGLGLSIVSAVAAAHGGRVDLTSGRGHTTFTVTLPLSEADEPALASMPS